jgi:proteasome lid subunit RPN8/RPN11
MTLLEERILDAHRRGATAELKRLQAEFRRTAVVTSVGRGQVRPAQLREGAAAGRLAVTLTESARRDLVDQIADYCDGREVGGALYGHRAGGTIVVDYVGGQNPDYVYRTSGSTEIVPDYCLEFQDWLREIGSASRWLGDFHTHEEEHPQPSRNDLKAWKGLHDSQGHGIWVGLIATPDYREREWRWLAPTLHAWVASRSAGGETVVKRAVLN